MLSRPAYVVAGLGSAQTLAWGSTYYLPAVLATAITGELGRYSQTGFRHASLHFSIRAIQMRFCRIIAAILFLISTASANAHVGGHGNADDALTARDAPQLAEKAVQSLLWDRKLDASWYKRQLVETKAWQGKGGRLWMVSYKNPAENDPKKQMLYVFMDELGNYLDVNHTGKAPD